MRTSSTPCSTSNGRPLTFFAGLFVIVGAMAETGVIEMLALALIDVTGGNVFVMMLVLLVGSAVISSFLDNIPFVATMIPFSLPWRLPYGRHPAVVGCLLGACLGGNGTLIGASERGPLRYRQKSRVTKSPSLRL